MSLMHQFHTIQVLCYYYDLIRVYSNNHLAGIHGIASPILTVLKSSSCTDTSVTSCTCTVLLAKISGLWLILSIANCTAAWTSRSHFSKISLVASIDSDDPFRAHGTKSRNTTFSVAFLHGDRLLTVLTAMRREPIKRQIEYLFPSSSPSGRRYISDSGPLVYLAMASTAY